MCVLNILLASRTKARLFIAIVTGFSYVCTVKMEHSEKELREY